MIDGGLARWRIYIYIYIPSVRISRARIRDAENESVRAKKRDLIRTTECRCVIKCSEKSRGDVFEFSRSRRSKWK